MKPNQTDFTFFRTPGAAIFMFHLHKLLILLVYVNKTDRWKCINSINNMLNFYYLSSNFINTILAYDCRMMVWIDAMRKNEGIASQTDNASC